MKRFLVVLATCICATTSALAVPSLGDWEEGAARSTHQYWDFTPSFISEIDGGYLAVPEELINPNPGGVKGQVSGIELTYDGESQIQGDLIAIDMKIPNYGGGVSKEIWVDVGLEAGEVFAASVVGGDGDYTSISLNPPQGSNADFGWRITPNPDWENILLLMEIDGRTAPAILDWVHVDTLCVTPVPGAVALAGIGVALLGWVRRRIL